ncbi:TPA: DUF4231 domain-containing protein [Photobacterium damselae]
MKNINIEQFTEESINHFRVKANHNKLESLLFFKSIMICSLIAPILITLSDDVIVGKILPSLCSVITAFGTAWLQKRKPHQLWTLYRTCQREIENELTLYQFNIGVYDDESNKEKILVEKISTIKMRSHKNWVELVPNPDDLNTSDDKSK